MRESEPGDSGQKERNGVNDGLSLMLISLLHRLQDVSSVHYRKLTSEDGFEKWKGKETLSSLLFFT